MQTLTSIVIIVIKQLFFHHKAVHHCNRITCSFYHRCPYNTPHIHVDHACTDIDNHQWDSGMIPDSLYELNQNHLNLTLYIARSILHKDLFF